MNVQLFRVEAIDVDTTRPTHRAPLGHVTLEVRSADYVDTLKLTLFTAQPRAILEQLQNAISCELAGQCDLLHDDDARMGIEWFNSLTPQQRAYWLAQAGSARPADAWATYKAADRGQLDRVPP
ncbi:MAG: hypothetical protein GWO02_05120 [Gammaproteobacteria bacterium]|nr:hypothetical protein [Gammaproteobacteria bacterium]